MADESHEQLFFGHDHFRDHFRGEHELSFHKEDLLRRGVHPLAAWRLGMLPEVRECLEPSEFAEPAAGGPEMIILSDKAPTTGRTVVMSTRAY